MWEELQLPSLHSGKDYLPVQETQEVPVWSLTQEYFLEEEMATHSSIFA